MSVIVAWQTPACQPKAAALAAALHLPLAKSAGCHASTADEPIFLQVTENRVELVYKTFYKNNPSCHTLFAEFLRGPLGYRWLKGGGKNQAIAKAVGLKAGVPCLTVLDATAGLGRDAFILAALGCKVELVERSGLMATLLTDGLLRASQDPKGAAVARSMVVVEGDAKKILAALTPENRPDVVYLDPMFPHQDKSALTKIEMRIIRSIVGDDTDAALLLPLALTQARKRVVVKRQRQAPLLAGGSPSFVVKGKSNRYDVYLVGEHT